MDCPACQGNGELETIQLGKEQHEIEEKSEVLVRDGFWPYTCPVCGGSGYLED
jgi:DnaJ-class molecular chaperone